VCIWEAATGKQLSQLRGHGDAVSSLAFRPDDPNVLVTGSWDKTVKLWDLSASTCLSTTRVDGEVTSVDLSPCGNKLSAACNNSRSGSYSVQIFSKEGSTGNFVCQSTLKGHSKDNEECTCTHDAGPFKDKYEANPDCPVSGHTR